MGSAALHVDRFRSVFARLALFSHTQRNYFSTANHCEMLEEENLPGYSAADFYPVRIGEEFNLKYKILGKLGYGSNSTIWLSERY